MGEVGVISKSYIAFKVFTGRFGLFFYGIKDTNEVAITIFEEFKKIHPNSPKEIFFSSHDNIFYSLETIFENREFELRENNIDYLERLSKFLNNIDIFIKRKKDIYELFRYFYIEKSKYFEKDFNDKLRKVFNLRQETSSFLSDICGLDIRLDLYQWKLFLNSLDKDSEFYKEFLKIYKINFVYSPNIKYIENINSLLFFLKYRQKEVEDFSLTKLKRYFIDNGIADEVLQILEITNETKIISLVQLRNIVDSLEDKVSLSYKEELLLKLSKDCIKAKRLFLSIEHMLFFGRDLEDVKLLQYEESSNNKDINSINFDRDIRDLKRDYESKKNNNSRVELIEIIIKSLIKINDLKEIYSNKNKEYFNFKICEKIKIARSVRSYIRIMATCIYDILKIELKEKKNTILDKSFWFSEMRILSLLIKGNGNDIEVDSEDILDIVNGGAIVNVLNIDYNRIINFISSKDILMDGFALYIIQQDDFLNLLEIFYDAKKYLENLELGKNSSKFKKITKDKSLQIYKFCDYIWTLKQLEQILLFTNEMDIGEYSSYQSQRTNREIENFNIFKSVYKHNKFLIRSILKSFDYLGIPLDKIQVLRSYYGSILYSEYNIKNLSKLSELKKDIEVLCCDKDYAYSVKYLIEEIENEIKNRSILHKLINRGIKIEDDIVLENLDQVDCIIKNIDDERLLNILSGDIEIFSDEDSYKKYIKYIKGMLTKYFKGELLNKILMEIEKVYRFKIIEQIAFMQRILKMGESAAFLLNSNLFANDKEELREIKEYLTILRLIRNKLLAHPFASSDSFNKYKRYFPSKVFKNFFIDDPSEEENISDNKNNLPNIFNVFSISGSELSEEYKREFFISFIKDKKYMLKNIPLQTSVYKRSESKRIFKYIEFIINNIGAYNHKDIGKLPFIRNVIEQKSYEEDLDSVIEFIDKFEEEDTFFSNEYKRDERFDNINMKNLNELKVFAESIKGKKGKHTIEEEKHKYEFINYIKKIIIEYLENYSIDFKSYIDGDNYSETKLIDKIINNVFLRESLEYFIILISEASNKSKNRDIVELRNYLIHGNQHEDGNMPFDYEENPHEYKDMLKILLKILKD